MPSSIIFPGSPGVNVSTPDTNLLDADTAHVQQSVGTWSAFAGAAITQSQDVPPVFGDYEIKSAGLSGANAGFRSVTTAPAISAGDWVFSCWIYSTQQLNTAVDNRLRMLVTGGDVNQEKFQAVAPNTWTHVEVPFTSAAGVAADTLDLYAQVLGLTQDTDIYLDAACLRSGSDGTFVPSLRIVGSLFETKEPSDVPIAFAADGTPLTVGDNWSGSLRRYARHDGPDGNAPVVAEVLPDDVLP